jgi:hypothetical protein
LESLEEILEEWSKDAVISDDIKTESLRTPKLHAKYLRIYSKHALRVKKYEFEYSDMKKKMWRYYTGKFSKIELEEMGLEQFRESLKSEVGMYLESDERLQDILLKKVYHEEAADVCKTILKEISQRSYHIRNAMDHLKFESGQ